MTKREYRPAGQGYPVQMIDGWPDHRGVPVVRVVCEGWRDKGTEHDEWVVATFWAMPFDPSKGECGNWVWDSDVAVGGEARHATTRLRERKAKRRVTPEEVDRGARPGSVEVGPKHHVGMTQTGGTIHLKCRRCTSDLRIKEAHLQELLDKTLLAELAPDADLEALQRIGARKLPLPALILLKTKPKSR